MGLLAVLLFSIISFSSAQSSKKIIGVNYGREGTNLSSPYQSIQILQSMQAYNVRLYDADPETLRLLSDINIHVAITVPNEIIPQIASNQSTANRWFHDNVLAYYPDTKIRFLLVGNEVLSSQNTNQSKSLVQAMTRLLHSLETHKIKNIKIGTPMAMDVLAQTNPPSSGRFKNETLSIMNQTLHFLVETKSYFFLNIFPYYYWLANPHEISLDYALFTGQHLTYRDPGSGLLYTNLLDQMLDAVNSAISKLGYHRIRIAISETGWPNAGGIDGAGANIYNAATYNRNLIRKMTASPPLGTPAKPAATILTFISSLYDEDLREGPATERHWGLLRPDGTPVYEFDLTGRRTVYGRLPEPTNNSPFHGRMWCVAVIGTSENELVSQMDRACERLNGTCDRLLGPGGDCYQPVSVVSHASYVFSAYWSMFRASGESCYFQGLARETTEDPSHGFCHLPRACAKRRTPSLGKKLHAQIIKLGLQHYGPLPNTLIDMYGKGGFLDYASQVFDELPERDYVSWASILTAHNHSELPHRTLAIFLKMWKLDGLLPDQFVIASLVKACTGLGNLRWGKQVHAHFVTSPFCDDDVVRSSLVDMYAKCGLVDDARSVFDSICRKNLISWTAMISGYARCGRKFNAIELFQRMPEKNLMSWSALISGLVQSGHMMDAFNTFKDMRRYGDGVRVDPFILSSIVGASANSATLELGRQIHGLVIVLGFEDNLFVANALVDMYAKCCDILAAKNVFSNTPRKDVVSWTSMIVGLAQHGQAEEALSSYGQMMLSGIKPNQVTFVGLIYACSHAGLVREGRRLFNLMTEDYGIAPSLQHYTCLLDLLSRSGLLDEAENLLKTMPFKPDEAAWAALLSACRQHRCTQIGTRVADHLLGLQPKDPSTYILLSNTYAAAAMWDSVSRVRKLMSANKLIKQEPGQSCIELGKESRVFYAGEEVSLSHPMKQQLVDLLTELHEEMRKQGYVPDTSYVLHEVGEHEKERRLFWHSERLAVAYGLLRSVPGVVIRVVKNLRICGDCHTVMKFICSIAGREIVIRDVNRFHHFKDGRCSCGDFW
ncbi:hypothetical protein Dimus_002200 [Dionaea muscipula]